MNLIPTIKFKNHVASNLLPGKQLECSLNLQNKRYLHWLNSTFFKEFFKKQKWEKYNERALVFLFFYTKFHVQALKSTLTGTYEIYSLSYRTF